MRSFEDEQGRSWVASVREWPGDDYKGRFEFILLPEDKGEEEGIPLSDVRWNSRETAERTLQTMSVVELCRRLRSAKGRVVKQGEGAY